MSNILMPVALGYRSSHVLRVSQTRADFGKPARVFSFIPSPTDSRNTGAGPRPAAVWYPHNYFAAHARDHPLLSWASFVSGPKNKLRKKSVKI